MSTLLAHIKIVEGHEEKFENISRELYEKTHSNEDSVIHYDYWRGREKGSYYTLLAYPTYLDFLITHQISDHMRQLLVIMVILSRTLILSGLIQWKEHLN